MKKSMIALAGLASALVPTSAQAAEPAPVEAAALPFCQEASVDTWGPLTYNVPSVTRNGNNFNCRLVHGNQFNGVYKLQDALTKCHNKNTNGVDGIYGDATRAAVRAVQVENNINPDGAYGPVTKTVMRWPLYNSSGTWIGCIND